MKTPEKYCEDFKLRQRENAHLQIVARLQQEKRKKVDECIRVFMKNIK